MVRAEEQEVFTTQTDRPQGIFSDVVVDFHPAIVRIVRQCRPLVKCVRERLRHHQAGQGLSPQAAEHARHTKKISAQWPGLVIQLSD